ncbi:MAG: 3-phosphoshikimate 1-carboxyvinyltransferase [Parachlamydiaceae bacterium]
MNIVEITAFDKPVTATIDIPGSKSYTNRALVMAALTKGPVTLCNPLYSEDTEAMIACLRTLGLRVETSPEQILVQDDISTIQNRSYELFAKDSGTTLRFLLPMLCMIPGVKILKGSIRLNERPIKDLVEALRQLGAKIEYLEKDGQPPLKIDSLLLCSGGEVTIDASMSSQFCSALLMIAPLFLNGIKIRFRGVVISKPYIDMTVGAMRESGIDVVQMEDGGYHIPPAQLYQKDRYVIEGDFSSAGYFFALAALTQSTMTLKNLNPLSAQADRKFLDILERMGNQIMMSDDGITIIGKQILPLFLDMEDCPDQVQTLAVLAAFAHGVTTISGVRSLRSKETERVQALKKELGKMGIKTEDTYDTLTIYGGDPRAATIDTYGDHRMAMAFAVAGTRLPGMKICHPEVVNKTFPMFWDKLRAL